MIDVVLGNIGGSSWGISSIFGGGDKSARENVASKQHAEPFHSVEVEQSFSMIHLTEVYILQHIYHHIHCYVSQVYVFIYTLFL